MKNTAKVQPGDSVAVFGLGGGIGPRWSRARAGRAGASSPSTPIRRSSPSPGRWAPPTASTPKDHDKPIQQVIVEMTGWGVDHSFECIGNVNVMRALECATAAGARA